MRLRDGEGVDPEGPECQQRSSVLVWAMGRDMHLESCSGADWGGLGQGLSEQQGRLWWEWGDQRWLWQKEGCTQDWGGDREGVEDVERSWRQIHRIGHLIAQDPWARGDPGIC